MTPPPAKKIAIDIGHARMTGARGCGLEEHALCADMAPLLKQQLEARGFEADIIDFPALDNKGDLVRTVEAINAGGYAASVSLHCDASDNPAAHGAHVCYASAAGEAIARAIAARLCPLMPGRANRTVRRRNLYVLNNTRCPAVLVECGFVTNEEDAAALSGHPGPLMLAVAAGLGQALA